MSREPVLPAWIAAWIAAWEAVRDQRLAEAAGHERAAQEAECVGSPGEAQWHRALAKTARSSAGDLDRLVQGLRKCGCADAPCEPEGGAQ